MPLKKSARYKYYISKKAKSKNAKAAEELEEQHESQSKVEEEKVICVQKLEALTSINVSKANDKTVHATILTEMKKLIPTHVSKVLANYVKPRLNNSGLESNTTHPTNQKLYDTLYESIILDQKVLDAQNIKPSFHKQSHNHQDPLTDHEGEKKKKRQKDASQSSTRSLRKDKAPMILGSADAAKRRTTWFDLLLKSDIDQNENHILKPSTMAIVKKLKELIQKDELTILDLEAATLEKFKQYSMKCNGTLMKIQDNLIEMETKNKLGRGRNVEVYLEEAVVKSKPKKDRIEDVEETLYKLQRINMKLVPNGCAVGTEEGKFLGYVAMAEGIKSDPEKVKSILQNTTHKV
nr:putative mitochondrial protein [Tanacetum cinerariifolium]